MARTLSPEEVTLLERYFDESDRREINKIVHLFADFERALNQLTMPGNDQWREGIAHMDSAKRCFVRSLADAVIDGTMR